MPGPTLFTTDLLLTGEERGIGRVDGTTIVDLYTEEYLTYHIMIRSDASICLYATHPAQALHIIIYDSLDGQAPNEQAKAVFKRLSWMRDAIDLLLAH